MRVIKLNINEDRAIFWIELKKMGLKTQIAWKLHLVNAYRRINPHKQPMSISIWSWEFREETLDTKD